MKEYIKVGWRMFILLMVVALGMTSVELYALSQGVNGYGIAAFFAGMGGVFSFGLRRKS